MFRSRKATSVESMSGIKIIRILISLEFSCRRSLHVDNAFAYLLSASSLAPPPLSIADPRYLTDWISVNAESIT